MHTQRHTHTHTHTKTHTHTHSHRIIPAPLRTCSSRHATSFTRGSPHTTVLMMSLQSDPSCTHPQKASVLSEPESMTHTEVMSTQVSNMFLHPLHIVCSDAADYQALRQWSHTYTHTHTHTHTRTHDHPACDRSHSPEGRVKHDSTAEYWWVFKSMRIRG